MRLVCNEDERDTKYLVVPSKNVYKIDKIASEFADNVNPEKSYLWIQKSFFICRKISHSLIEV